MKNDRKNRPHDSHDSLKSIDKLRTALPESIKWLKEQGYEFKTF